MIITHPQGPYGTVPAENVFLAMDDLGPQMGMGYVIAQYQPSLYPDCPLNLYFMLDAAPAARYMLLGALVARARQLRDANRQVNARIYTGVRADDAEMLDFYEHVGFTLDGGEELQTLAVPIDTGRVPMSCAIAPMPLNTQQELSGFLYRLAQNDLGHIDPGYVQYLQRMPHFSVLGLQRNNVLIGEAMVAGEGNHAELAAIYITPENRGQGMARALLHRTLAVMHTEGVTDVTARIMTRSLPQVHLMRNFGARTKAVMTIFPAMNL